MKKLRSIVWLLVFVLVLFVPMILEFVYLNDYASALQRALSFWRNRSATLLLSDLLFFEGGAFLLFGALIAGTILGKNVAEAIEANDVSEANLWQYNLDYIKEYGYKTAGLELFRRLVQQMTNDQISYGMKHFLGNMDVESISKGEHPDFTGLGKVGMIIRGALNQTVAKGLKYTSTENQWLVEHYNNYPKDPQGFDEWNKSLHQRLEAAFAKIEVFND